MLITSTLLSLVLSTATAPAAAPLASPAPDAAVVFSRLTSLVGSWKGTAASGRSFTVTYRLSAGDSVLVETWTLGSGRESMTLYHLDGPTVVATHYCPIGNQPTLELATAANEGEIAFRFRAATNLPDPGVAHQSAFVLRLIDHDHYWRSETYVEHGEESTEAVSYQRTR